MKKLMTKFTGCVSCRAAGFRLSARKTIVPCKKCIGRGLVLRGELLPRVYRPKIENLSVGIIGGGIGGMELALALQQRNIKCTIFEKDPSFHSRCQGYGLTLQQGTGVLIRMGIDNVTQYGSKTIKHTSFLPDGTILGSYGGEDIEDKKQSIGANEAGGEPSTKKQKKGPTPRMKPKRCNIMLPRQKLREILYDELQSGTVMWGQKFVKYDMVPEEGVQKVNVSLGGSDGTVTEAGPFDVLVGADGIWSKVRAQMLAPSAPPRYLGVMVILGRAKTNHPLGRCIFQTMDGETRIYAMPFTSHDGVMMWQLSFPMALEEARALSDQGHQALLNEERRRCSGWHEPIGQILADSLPEDTTGYPTFDRAPPCAENGGAVSGPVALIGDSVHPMSPFKGQGANQALLDGHRLATALGKHDSIAEALGEYESDMIKRVRAKVEGSAKAADVLHSKEALVQGNVTRATAHRR